MIDAPILIVGAGPTGLALACALGRQGVRCRIIDQAGGPAEESRAIAIQARTLEIFDQWGIVDDFISRGLPIHGVRLYGEDRQQIFHLEFADLPTQFPFVLSLPQKETEEILGKHAEELSYKIERNTKLASVNSDSEGVSASLEKGSGEIEEARFQWIIGCDGAHSVVRELSHLQFEGKEYPQQFILADVAIDWPLAANEAHIFTSQEGIFGCFPLPGGSYRLIAAQEVGDPTRAPQLEGIQTLMSARGPKDARITDLYWSSNFHIHARLVEALQQGRLILVGDAAHIHSPALAQGMNTGIQDAGNLAWKLALVVKGLADPTLLESYGQERWPVERGVLAQTDFVTNVMSGATGFKAWLRDHIGPIIMANERVGKHVRELVSELSISYAESPFVLSNKNGLPLKAGERAPDAFLEHEGRETRLYELMRGPGHYLLVLSDQDDVIGTSDFPAGELTVHQIRQNDANQPGPIDRKGQVSAAYGWDCAYLIRPDGYIGATIDKGPVPTMVSAYAPKIRSQLAVGRSKAELL